MCKINENLREIPSCFATLGFVACSSDDDSDDGDSVNTNPDALYNTTWLYEENDSDSEECTNKHYSSSSSDDDDNYTKSKTKSEAKSEENTESVSTYYLRTEKDRTAYFGKASFSRKTTTTYDEVTYTYTDKTSGLTYNDTEKENEKTTVEDGEKTYTPLYKGSISVNSTNANAAYTFTQSYSSNKWSESSQSFSAPSAVSAKLYKSSTKPYALSVKIKGSTLKLIYDTETNQCGEKLDSSGTKCTTELKTEYYGKWSKISLDATMLGNDSGSSSKESGKTDTSSSTTSAAFDYVTTDTSNPLGEALSKLSAGETLADGTYGEVKIGEAKFAWVKRGRANASSRASDGQYLTLAAASKEGEYDGGTFTINVKKGAKVSITAKFDKYCMYCMTIANFRSGTSRTNYWFEFYPEEGGGFCTAEMDGKPEKGGTLYFCNTKEFALEISEIKVEY